jgi:hypothetical protein
MTKSIALAFVLAVAAMAHPAQAQTAGRNGPSIMTPDEFSSRQRSEPGRVARMHYFDPYPWWWHPPYLKRARTNYLGWPHSVYPPDYDSPYFGGVAGYPGGFWIAGQ